MSISSRVGSGSLAWRFLKNTTNFGMTHTDRITTVSIDMPTITIG